MNKTRQRNQSADAVTEHKRKKVGKKPMDIAMQVAGALAVITGVVMAVLAVLDVKHKASVTLWLGYFAVLCALTGLCLYLQKQIWENEAKAAAQPELFIEEAQITPLVVGKTHTVVMLLRNRGNGHARNIKLGPNNASLKPKDFAGPLSYGESPFSIDTTTDLAAGAASTVAVTATIYITEDRLEQLNDGDLLYFHYGEGSYQDDTGRTYPLSYCFMYAPVAPTILRVCPTHYRPRKDSQNEKQR